MGLYKYSIDGSRLSLNDRKKLMQLLDDYSDSGLIYVDMKKGLYQAFFEENVNVSSLPFPTGTILNQIYQ